MRDLLAAQRPALAHLVTDTTDVALLVDADRHIVWASPSCESTLGWDPADLMGTNPANLLHPDDMTEARLRSANLRSRGSEDDEQRGWLVRLRCRGGTYRWMSGTVSRIDDESGTLIGFTAVLCDVDESMRQYTELPSDAQQMHAFLDSMLDPFALLAGVRDDAGHLVDLVFIECNKAALQANQLRRGEMIGHRLLDLFPRQVDGGPLSLYFEVMETGTPCVLDDYVAPHEVIDQRRRYDIRAVKAGPNLLALTWRDVTDRYHSQMALRQTERLYRLATEGISDAVAETDRNLVITWVSPSFEQLTGFSRDEVVGQVGLGIVHEPDTEAIQSALALVDDGRDAAEIRLRLQHKDATSHWVAVKVRASVDELGGPIGYIAVLRDIDDEMRIYRELRTSTQRDPLTGLPTRERFVERLTDVAENLPPDTDCTVLKIGIDRLGRINQALTYHAGDLLIQTIAARIQSVVPDLDDQARVDGDAFALLLRSPAGQAEPTEVADRLLAAVREPIIIDGHSITPTVTIGIARLGDSGDTDRVLAQAAAAMHAAKELGRDRWSLAGEDQGPDALRKLVIHAELKDAIETALLAPWFQPIVALPSGHVVGFEVLARWPGKDGADYMPAAFVPMAEEMGLAPALDRLMLSKALAYLPEIAPLTLAVNISMRTLSDPDEMRHLVETVRHHGQAAYRLHLEVTETALAVIGPEAIAAMREIRDLGVPWYVDDFGTGYSSISSLRDLPIEGLKLDRSFTEGLSAGDSRSIQVAQGLAGLSHGLALKTIAEGVEDITTARLLAAQGWQCAQGFLYGKDMPTPALSL